MMPTPERMRWVTTELAIEMLEHYAQGEGRQALAKQLARWFPDASPAELRALEAHAGEHFSFYAGLLRGRSNRMVANGKMVEGSFPS